MNPSLLPEIGPDGLARESPVIAYTEKIIEEEQLQLQKYIQENYSKIRDVERELANLTREVKLTSGPKKAALELMRKKIELSTERIRVAKVKEEQAHKAWEEASKVVKDEEEIKQKLCDDLNRLVQESSNAQFSRLEELKRRLEALNPGRASVADALDQKAVQPALNSTAASDSPSNPQKTISAVKTAETVLGQGNNGSGMDGNNQQPHVEGDGRGKKRSSNSGRGRGLGAVPKGRGSPGPGWTGAGFDVDGRS